MINGKRIDYLNRYLKTNNLAPERISDPGSGRLAPLGQEFDPAGIDGHDRGETTRRFRRSPDGSRVSVAELDSRHHRLMSLATLEVEHT